MKPVEWTEALVLHYEPLDALHKEFIKRLAAVQAGADTSLARCWALVIEHTERQFASEDRWMSQSGYAGAGNHLLQHRVVLKLMREGLAKAQAGDTAAVREMAEELAAWFPKHTQSQDAALALHLRHLH